MGLRVNDCLTVAAVIAVFISQNNVDKPRRRILNLFAEDHGHIPLADIRPADLVFWLHAHPEWQSDWTRKRILSQVQRPFLWAVRLGLIERNPFGGISHPSGKRGRPMTDQEFRTILRNSDAAYRRAVMALRYTGMRCGELRALQWEHLDTHRQAAVMPHHKTARTRKDRRPRLIVFHPSIWRMILWIHRTQPRHRFIFLNSHGSPWTSSNIEVRFKRLRKRTGLPDDCKLHGARHAFCRALAMEGIGMATIAEVVGHTTLEMASYYVDLYGQTGHLRDAVMRAVGHVKK